MAYDTKCFDLAEAFLEDHPDLNTQANRDTLAQLIQTTIEDEIAYMERRADEASEPCTEGARRAGCTCTMESVHSASIDPPEPVTDRNCPLHGNLAARDPDYARDIAIENDRLVEPYRNDDF